MVSEFGKDYPYHGCSGPNGAGIYFCGENSLYPFWFNSKTLRYQRVYGLVYIIGGENEVDKQGKHLTRHPPYSNRNLLSFVGIIRTSNYRII